MVAIMYKKLPSYVIAAAVICSVAGCRGERDIQEILLAATAHEKAGDTKAAIIELKNAVQKDPKSASARALLGTIYAAEGDPLSAEKELRKAIELGADAASLTPILGRALIQQGQFQKALDLHQSASQSSSDPAVLAMRGNAYLGLGKPEQAKEAFERALQVEPDNLEALLGTGRLALGAKDTDAAARLAKDATIKHPRAVTAWLFAGDVHRARREQDQAVSAYAEAIKQGPQNISGYLARANLYIASGSHDLARADLDAAAKLAPKAPVIFFTRALLDYTRGSFEAARQSILEVLRIAPDHMPSELLAGAIQYELGATQQAEQHLKKFLDNEPGDFFASKLLAATLLKNGNSDAALKILNPMLSQKQADSDRQLLVLAGEAHRQARNTDKATMYLEKASALTPNEPGIRTALGLSRLAQGDHLRGVAELERATELDPKTLQPGIVLAMAHVRLKEYDKALAAVAKLERSQPDNAILQNLKGEIHASQKDNAAARASFDRALVLQPDYFAPVSNLAKLDLADRKPELAQERIEKFLSKNPKSVEAMIAMGGLAQTQGKPDDMMKWLENAAKEQPADLRIALLLGAHYLGSAQKTKALTHARSVQAAHPANPAALDLLARSQMLNNDAAAALGTYEQVAQLSPASALPQYQIALTYLALKDEKGAKASLKKALEKNPDYVEAHLALATLENRSGNGAEALAIARKMQKRPANARTGYELEGDILLSQKKPDLAVKAYAEAVALGGSSTSVIKLSQALQQSGRAEEGTRRLAAWLNEHPDDMAVSTYMAELALKSGDFKSACAQYKRALARSPDSIVALNNLAHVLHAEKDPSALSYAERAYKLAPNNAAIMDTLGWILLDAGDGKRALALLQKAASMAPDNLDIRYHFAAGLAKIGDKARARKELENLLAQNKPFSSSQQAQALLQEML